MPIDHVRLPISDLDASQALLLGRALAVRLPARVRRGSRLGRGDDGSDENEPFDLLRVGRPSIPTHVALTATSTAQVNAFYEAAMAAGGRDNGPPGERAALGG